MAGSISLSLSQQFDSTGAPLNGGLLYFYAAGTTTPQSAYQDTSLTIPWPNPIVLDSAGRIPPFYLEDGQIKIRLTDSAGVTQVSADNLLVVGASSGSGSAPSVDATTILATGDIKYSYRVGALTGWVRSNGRTVGSATSGATERANADCQALFEYLWTADASLSVSTGRGASAAADWAANKNIALPDFRGRVIASPDSMGSTAAGRLGSGAGSFLTNNDTLGFGAGAEVHTLTTAQLPVHTPSGSVSVSTPSVLAPPTSAVANQFLIQTGTVVYPAAQFSNFPAQTATFTGNSIGSGSAHDTMPPAILITCYMKL